MNHFLAQCSTRLFAVSCSVNSHFSVHHSLVSLVVRASSEAGTNVYKRGFRTTKQAYLLYVLILHSSIRDLPFLSIVQSISSSPNRALLLICGSKVPSHPPRHHNGIHPAISQVPISPQRTTSQDLVPRPLHAADRAHLLP